MFVSLCIAILLAASSRAADESAEKIITKSFPVEPGGSVAVTADQGDIELVTGKQNVVEVVVERTVTGVSESKATKILKKHKVTATLEGSTVYVETKIGKDADEDTLKKKTPELAVHIRVTVPKRFDARLDTAGGNITATGLEGGVEAKTAGGDLSFTHIRGAVNGNSAGGNINVMGGTDKMQVRTGWKYYHSGLSRTGCQSGQRRRKYHRFGLHSIAGGEDVRGKHQRGKIHRAAIVCGHRRRNGGGRIRKRVAGGQLCPDGGWKYNRQAGRCRGGEPERGDRRRHDYDGGRGIRSEGPIAGRQAGRADQWRRTKADTQDRRGGYRDLEAITAVLNDYDDG